MPHRVRELLMRQRIMLVNALCGHLAEWGRARQCIVGVGMLIWLVEDRDSEPAACPGCSLGRAATGGAQAG